MGKIVWLFNRNLIWKIRNKMLNLKPFTFMHPWARLHFFNSFRSPTKFLLNILKVSKFAELLLNAWWSFSMNYIQILILLLVHFVTTLHRSEHFLDFFHLSVKHGNLSNLSKINLFFCSQSFFREAQLINETHVLSEKWVSKKTQDVG